MIGRQEELKLLLNQSNPASLGARSLTTATSREQRSRKIESIQSDDARACSSWSRRSSSKRRNCRSLKMTPTREIAGLQHARAERSDGGRGAHEKIGERQLRNWAI